MDHYREAIVKALEAEKATLRKLELWYDSQIRYENEMITRFGFSIEPIGTIKEQLVRSGGNAELEVLRKDASLHADPTPEQWTQVVDFFKEKGINLEEFCWNGWKIISPPPPDNANNL